MTISLIVILEIILFIVPIPTLLFKIVVDVLFKLLIDNVELVDKLLIDNIELVDNEFKLLYIVVDVAFKLLIDNIELVDNEFELLNKTDKYCLIDFPIGYEQQVIIKKYRQDLRNFINENEIKILAGEKVDFPKQPDLLI